MPHTDHCAGNTSGEAAPWCRDHRGRPYSFEEFLELTRTFHGYPAPGVVIGAKMVDIAMNRMTSGVLFDAVCETAKCLPDAVQLLTPCTWGNGWLRVVPFGRYALTLFDKHGGSGVRVYVDPARLDAYPEVRYWFFGIKPKRKDKTDLLLREIRQAQELIYGVQAVRVKPDILSKTSSDPRAICPNCHEAYPAGHGSICRGCRLETGYLLQEKIK
jgi:formylmethanofuran dehydrogenase subunit E